MTKPHIIVAGLGRCGTTLMMHMLRAAGIPCIGEPPAFEVDETNHRKVSDAFLSRHPGHALKLLDPHLTPLPLASAPTIWLDRDAKEQAKSQAKMATIIMGLPTPSRLHMRRWCSGLRSDRSIALAALPPGPRLRIAFEGLINAPSCAAHSVAAFLAPWWPELDAAKMAAVVKPRSAACASDLSIELALVDEAERAAGTRGIPRDILMGG